MSERYVCIHAHFYQPPRENPWLEAVELQDSAYPYHDWNERITAECYAPNAASRILDGENRIVQIVNNYSKISFNFGPTLLSWMEQRAPDVYQGILEADRESRKRFGGHGSAMAQAYNHLIMPLANRRDKWTQVAWGIRDFQHRFGRSPEGMWLPETAVDLETLDILAEQGIRFTVLSPYQARRVRPTGGQWREVGGGRIDPSMAYILQLPSGRSIQLFFYDGPVSRAVAFENLLEKGEYFAGRLMSAFDDKRTWPQLAHIATDGETYGHHRAHGDMALAYTLHHIETGGAARLTNYGQFLELHPATHEVEIFENSAWSCAHGVERWRSNCGCNSGMRPGWHQEWRLPLREALDALRDTLAPLYEQAAGELLRDAWAARDAYIDLVLDRGAECRAQFWRDHARKDLSPEAEVRALRLLELQRHAMLMYTSCGWFFDDLSGIETVQVIQYAGRALQLAQELFGDGHEEAFLSKLERARSNVPAHGDGRQIYDKFVRPAMVDLNKVGAHFAVSSLFESYGPETRTFCYRIDRQDYKLLSAGKTRLAIGRAKITSEITRESTQLTFGVVHMGDHNVSGGVRAFRSEEAYQALAQEISATFDRGDFHELLRLLGKHFEAGAYTLNLLFRDEQRRILRAILESTLEQADAAYRTLYENHAALMRFLASLGMPQPKHFQLAAELTLNAELRRAIEAQVPDVDRIGALLEESRRAGVQPDAVTLEFALRRRMERLAREFSEDATDTKLLRTFEAMASLATSLPFPVNLWGAQNEFYRVLQDVYPKMQERAGQGVEPAREWTERFRALGQKLRVRVE